MKARRRRACSGAVGLLLMVACSPTLLWSRHTNDRLLDLEVRAKSGQVWLDVIPRGEPSTSRRRRGPFDEIAVDHAVFSDDGKHFALPARTGNAWFVVRDLDVEKAWSGIGGLVFDARGQHLAYAAEDAGRWRVVIDGQAEPTVDAIGEPLAFSEDGARVGYVAIDQGATACARVVLARESGPCWRGILALAVGCTAADDTYVAVADGAKVIVRGGALVARFQDVNELRVARCATRWAASVRQGGAARVIVDGETQAPARRITELAFSPGGDRVAYAAERDGWVMNVDGHDGDRFESLGPPTFSADGAHVAYLGKRDGDQWLIVDGLAERARPSALGLALAPDGKRSAYIAGSAAHPVVLCDGVSHPFSLVVEQTLTFSRDGRHWGILAGEPATRTLFIAIDGVARVSVDGRELFGSGASGPPAAVATFLQRWVAAELEIFLAARRAG
jgi:hypothetical protein